MCAANMRSAIITLNKLRYLYKDIMNNRLILILAITGLLLWSACSKQRAVVPIAVIPAGDTQKTVTTVSLYPYSDTFNGAYTDAGYADYGSGYLTPEGTSTTISFLFLITHINDSQIVVRNWSDILATGATGPIYISDTFIRNSTGIYLSRPDPLRNIPPHMWQNGVDSIAVNDSLHLNWDYIRPICADQEDHFCVYAGKKTSGK